MYCITRNRKDRKLPKLRDMLEAVINDKHKEQRKRREKIKNMSIEDIAETRDYLEEDQFENLKGRIKKIREQ